jgi:hypothetical protein
MRRGVDSSDAELKDAEPPPPQASRLTAASRLTLAPALAHTCADGFLTLSGKKRDSALPLDAARVLIALTLRVDVSCAALTCVFLPAPVRSDLPIFFLAKVALSAPVPTTLPLSFPLLPSLATRRVCAWSGADAARCCFACACICVCSSLPKAAPNTRLAHARVHAGVVFDMHARMPCGLMQ